MAVSLNATCVLPVSPNFGQAKHCQKGPEDQGGRQELALTTSLLRKALSVVGVKAQARLLLSRLETIGLGAAAAAGRRNNALNLERLWANQRRADLLSRVQGRVLLRRGQFRKD